MGYLSVGMFFFFTGYGLMFSFQKKKDYLDHFLLKRLLPLYLFYVVLIVLYVLYNILLGNGISIKGIVKSLIFGETIVPLGWYLQVTFLVYLLFYGIARVFKRQWVIIVIMGICLLIYCVTSACFGLITTWYESVFCVLLGMILSLKKETIDSILSRRALLIMLGSGILFALCLIGSYVLPLGVLFKMASALFFAIAVISLAFILQNTHIVCNRITTILGTYSLEIYVSQGFMLLLRHGASIHIDDPCIFVICAFVGTFVIALLMKKIYGLVVLLTAKIRQ